MAKFKAFAVALLCAIAISTSIQAQSTVITTSSAPGVVQEARGTFRSALGTAIRKAAKEKKITRAEALRLRVAMLSPAFRKHAEDLAVIQMAFSGSDLVPFDAEGRVERGSIDWDAFAAFLERIIPLLLDLLLKLGVGL